MDVNKLKDIYTDYLLVCQGQITATGISAFTGNTICHDQFTRLLSSGFFSSESLWGKTKSMCHEIRNSDAVLIFDDSIEEKKYTDSNELIQWHFDHTIGKCVKGVNFLTALYHSNEISLPVCVDFVKKTKPSVNKKGKAIMVSETTKNEIFRTMLYQSSYNLDFKYVLNDSWFSSADNMSFCKNECRKDFIMAIKNNRKVALTQEDKKNGVYVNIKSLGLEGCVMSVYFEKLDFPISLSKQVFKNGDGSTGELYLASSDLSLTFSQITTIYKKRWKVEEYHKSIKSNTAFSKSPTRTPRTQISHFIASITAYVKLELIKIRTSKNHFALKSRINMAATKAAYLELKKLSTPRLNFDINFA